MFYESKVKCDRVQEQDCTVKMVTEVYMVDALTFAEAEARITEEVAPSCKGEFDVVALKRTNIKEICESRACDDGKWYNCKLEYIGIDEHNSKERKTYYNIMVKANNIAEAREHVNDHMRSTFIDFVFKSITETKVIEVYASKSSNY